MKNLIFLFLSSLLIDTFYCSFPVTLFNEMNKEKNGKNLIISPLSIYQVLSLTANGAKGDTQKEMLNVLRANSLDELNKYNYNILSLFKDFSSINIANAVMTRFTPLEDFCNTAEKYLAPIDPLVSVEQVNDWCSNKTHGKINKILDKLGQETVMILLNAIYFKGEWVCQFERDLTKSLPFYNFGKEEKNVDTMIQRGHFKYYEDKKIQAIELKFKEDHMSALILLPSSSIDINTYLSYFQFSYNAVEQIIDLLEFKEVYLQLPKFEVSFSENLNQVLIDLGMYNAFSESDADFTGLREQGGLFISKVIHKTYLKVNEEGTEGAAITMVGMDESAEEPTKIYNMKVNRPFLFFLINSELPKDNNIIFMAKIENIE